MNLEHLWETKLKGRAWQVPTEFISLLKLMLDHKISSVLEIGTYKGGTALGFLEIGCSVLSIDKEFHSEVLELQARPNFSFVLRDSKDAEVLPNFDMLFIDGGHSYEMAKHDYEKFSPNVRKGGLIVFHDIVPDGVNDMGCADFWRELKRGKAVQEFIHDGKWGGIGVTYK